MTDDRSLERAARSWLEHGPTEAPDHAVEAALLRIQSTPQERDWHVRVPWRNAPMSITVRLAAAMAAVLIVAVAGVLALRPGLSTVTGDTGPSPSIAASASHGASATPGPSASIPAVPSGSLPPLSEIVPDGTYLGVPIDAATIRSQLDSTPSLTAAEKAAVLDTILKIRTARTYQTRIAINGSRMTVSQGVDGTFEPELWSIAPAGEKSIAATWSGGTITFEVGICGPTVGSCGLTLQALSSAPTPVEGFVRRVVFEMSGPFAPQP